ncbi:hypothetical protein BDN72DRAFT_921404 [Pluteus cervinus]|uniref:Uncharacterized protein n=1 Tax=Pluteus cervinus TaxID=181527 RepID=A0ACD3AH98_9AGAR|nr:hypothetical protein BDN72DRAFT_921404 [Pluteus cervinus]
MPRTFDMATPSGTMDASMVKEEYPGVVKHEKIEPDDNITIQKGPLNPPRIKKEEYTDDENLVQVDFTDFIPSDNEDLPDALRVRVKSDYMMYSNLWLYCELETALESLDFKGSYAISQTFSEAPNPWLHIEGLGLIGLPLSEREAKLIIQASSQTPVFDSAHAVGHSWEIEPQRLSFENSKWPTFVNETVLKLVCKGLPVGTAFSPALLCCELSKSLLYETGLHPLSHQDKPKSPGIFATIVVVLPSRFTGGEVSVSHSGQTKTFDIAPDSMLTSVVSRYIDAAHDDAPVTSGYRLALSYNLVHTSTNPLPTFLPSEDTLAEIRRVLRKWKGGLYRYQRDIVASILEHRYSSSELSHGLAALKVKMPI